MHDRERERMWEGGRERERDRKIEKDNERKTERMKQNRGKRRKSSGKTFVENCPSCIKLHFSFKLRTYRKKSKVY